MYANLFSAPFPSPLRGGEASPKSSPKGKSPPILPQGGGLLLRSIVTLIFHSSLFTQHFAEGDLSVFCVRDPTPNPSPRRGGEWEVVPYSTAELPEKTRQHFDTRREGIDEAAQDIFKYYVECWPTLHVVLTFAPCRISRLFTAFFVENYAAFVCIV